MNRMYEIYIGFHLAIDMYLSYIRVISFFNNLIVWSNLWCYPSLVFLSRRESLRLDH